MAATGEADALAVGDPGGHLYLELALDHATSTTAALATGLLGHAALAVTCVACDRPHHLPEGGARGGLQPPGAGAALTCFDRRSRLGAVAAAVLAAVDRLEGDLLAHAAQGVDQLDVDFHRDIAPRRRAGARAERAAAPEEGIEQVPDRSERVEVRRPAPGGEPLVAIAVVGGPPLGVGEDLVRLRRLLEFLLGVGVVRVHVRVQLACQLAEGLLDLLLGGIAPDAKHLVGIARSPGAIRPRHRSPRRTATARARPRARSRSRRRSPYAPARSPTPRPAGGG